MEQPVWEMVEQHGLDEKRTVLLRGLPGNVCNPAKLKEIIQYPPAKVCADPSRLHVPARHGPRLHTTKVDTALLFGSWLVPTSAQVYNPSQSVLFPQRCGDTMFGALLIVGPNPATPKPFHSAVSGHAPLGCGKWN